MLFEQLQILFLYEVYFLGSCNYRKISFEESTLKYFAACKIILTREKLGFLFPFVFAFANNQLSN